MARQQLILDTARTLAESEGWDAVTTRRLSAQIEYSQPVLYKHFDNMEAIAKALAVDGLGELADALRAARTSATSNSAPEPMAHAYLAFARRNPSGEWDVDTMAEVLWATLHGLVMLDRGGRLRPSHDDERIGLLVARFWP